MSIAGKVWQQSPFNLPGTLRVLFFVTPIPYLCCGSSPEYLQNVSLPVLELLVEAVLQGQGGCMVGWQANLPQRA